jgi:pimeloyl-ACP methyl ester carboxylesterase
LHLLVVPSAVVLVWFNLQLAVFTPDLSLQTSRDLRGVTSHMFKRVVGGSFDQPSVWVLHGLLGQGRNWQSVATTLQKRTLLQFVLLDLRNHGRSHGFAPPHTMEACVEDLVACGRQLQRSPAALIGHSLGGKVLLQLARSPKALEDLASFVGRPGSAAAGNRMSLFVVDSFPGALTHSRRDKGDGVDGVFEVLDFIRSVPPVIPSKKWLVEQCTARGISMDIALWLASNTSELPTRPHGDHPQHQSVAAPNPGLRWMFDPAGAAEMFESHNASDCWDVLVDGPPPGVDLHFIMASRSTRWQHAKARAMLADAARAQAAVSEGDGRPEARGNVFLHTVDAGHWVHADNPSALTDIIAGALLRWRRDSP